MESQREISNIILQLDKSSAEHLHLHENLNERARQIVRMDGLLDQRRMAAVELNWAKLREIYDKKN
jgi:hypothetical protein